MLSLFNISHFSLTVCSEAMAKKITTRFRRRTSHSEIATNDEPYCKCAIERIILDFSKPVEEAVEIKIPGVRKLREERTGQLVVGSDQKTASDYYHE